MKTGRTRVRTRQRTAPATAAAPAAEPAIALENGTGVLLLESGDRLLLE